MINTPKIKMDEIEELVEIEENIQEALIEPRRKIEIKEEAKRIAKDLTNSFGLSVVGVYLIGSDSKNNPINLACVCSNCGAKDSFGVPYHLREYTEAETKRSRIKGYEIKFSFYNENDSLPEGSLALTGKETRYSDAPMRF